MNRFDRIFATALAGAALTLCVAANSIAANAESAPSAAVVAYSYTLEGTVIETQDDLKTILIDGKSVMDFVWDNI